MKVKLYLSFCDLPWKSQAYDFVPKIDATGMIISEQHKDLIQALSSGYNFKTMD
jgi:hypothetical protein